MMELAYDLARKNCTLIYKDVVQYALKIDTDWRNQFT